MDNRKRLQDELDLLQNRVEMFLDDEDEAYHHGKVAGFEWAIEILDEADDSTVCRWRHASEVLVPGEYLEGGSGRANSPRLISVINDKYLVGPGGYALERTNEIAKFFGPIPKFEE